MTLPRWNDVSLFSGKICLENTEDSCTEIDVVVFFDVMRPEPEVGFQGSFELFEVIDDDHNDWLPWLNLPENKAEKERLEQKIIDQGRG